MIQLAVVGAHVAVTAVFKSRAALWTVHLLCMYACQTESFYLLLNVSKALLFFLIF